LEENEGAVRINSNEPEMLRFAKAPYEPAVCFIEKKRLMKTIYYRSADSARIGALWVVGMRQSPKAVLTKRI
jgi:hypothetical protein